MSKLSLRELLQRVSEPPYKGVVPSHYELLGALVEAVEPERQPEEKPRNMMQERDSARAKVCALKVECNKLRAEIEMWRDECREWQSSTHQLRKRLVEVLRSIQEESDDEAPRQKLDKPEEIC